jgi:hypothetical protein
LISAVAFSTLAFVRSLFRYAILPIIMVVLHTSIAERACPQFNRSVFISGKGLLAFGGTNTATDPGPIDGNFGPRTEAAVRAYQTQQNITVDGIVGDQTWWNPAGAAGATLASLAGLVTA